MSVNNLYMTDKAKHLHGQVFKNKSKKISNSEHISNFMNDQKIKASENSIFLDRQIGNSKQGNAGDCALLATINSLNYTDEGQDILKYIIRYGSDRDGDYTVHGHLSDQDYEISYKELLDAKHSPEYADGDDDVVALELIAENFFDDITSKKVKISSDAPDYIQDLRKTKASSEKDKSHAAKYPSQTFFVLTNKKPTYADNKEDMNKLLDKFQKDNKKDFALTACVSSGEDFSLTNKVTGKKYYFSGNHAYSIKDVTDKLVTLTNPWNSKVRFTTTREEFLNHFDYLTGCDLSNYNQREKYFYKSDSD